MERDVTIQVRDGYQSDKLRIMVDGSEYMLGRDYKSLESQPYEFYHEELKMSFRLSVEYS